jgi:hypothetical protein
LSHLGLARNRLQSFIAAPLAAGERTIDIAHVLFHQLDRGVHGLLVARTRSPAGFERKASIDAKGSEQLASDGDAIAVGRRHYRFDATERQNGLKIV